MNGCNNNNNPQNSGSAFPCEEIKTASAVFLLLRRVSEHMVKILVNLNAGHQKRQTLDAWLFGYVQREIIKDKSIFPECLKFVIILVNIDVDTNNKRIGKLYVGIKNASLRYGCLAAGIIGYSKRRILYWCGCNIT